MAVKSELSVIVRAQDLCHYIITITKKSPKHYRSSYTAQLNAMGVNAVAYLYRANDTFVAEPNAVKKYQDRVDLQNLAMTELRLLAFVAEMAAEDGAILKRQFEQISLQVENTLRLLGGWMRSDRKRYGYE